MLGRAKPAGGLRDTRNLDQQRSTVEDVLPSRMLDTIKTHLGGDALLARLGAHGFGADHDHVSFCFDRQSPNGVRSVVIALEPRDYFNMYCYGTVGPGHLSAPLIATARQILPENLATVLGQLTGFEAIHHRHF